MTLHGEGDHNLFEMLYNEKHKWMRSIVENAFNILKKTFHEL
jgi:hypothetical protein